MTIATLTTLDITIRVTDSDTHLFILYGHVFEQLRTADRSRYIDLTSERDLSLSVNIDGRDYYASGVMLPVQSSANKTELMIVWVKTANPAIYHVFTLHADYSAWGVKMDVLRADNGIDEFLQLSAERKGELLGLS